MAASGWGNKRENEAFLYLNLLMMFMYYFYLFIFLKLSIIIGYCCQLFAGLFADSDTDKLNVIPGEKY